MTTERVKNITLPGRQVETNRNTLIFELSLFNSLGYVNQQSRSTLISFFGLLLYLAQNNLKYELF